MPDEVLVCGSRVVPDPDAARRAIAERLKQLPSGTVITHGAARGVDGWADAIAWSLGFTTLAFPADWKRYKRSAGIVRNLEMLEREPSLVLAFWDGQSPGTQHTIREAQKREIPVEVIKV